MLKLLLVTVTFASMVLMLGIGIVAVLSGLGGPARWSL
jgi:hypothetical protein